MSDSGEGNQFGGEVIEAIKETGNEVVDAVGEAIEQGVQSVIGPKLTPQQIQQKQQQDQRDLAETRRRISWLRNIDEEQKKVREANMQKEQQRLESQQQDKQEEVQKIQIQQAKQVKTPEEVLRAQAERKVGKGVGG